MNKETYYELLNHPKWIEKRSGILKRDHHQCTRCGYIHDPLNRDGKVPIGIMELSEFLSKFSCFISGFDSYGFIISSNLNTSNYVTEKNGIHGTFRSIDWTQILHDFCKTVNQDIFKWYWKIVLNGINIYREEWEIREFHEKPCNGLKETTFRLSVNPKIIITSETNLVVGIHLEIGQFDQPSFGSGPFSRFYLSLNDLEELDEKMLQNPMRTLHVHHNYYVLGKSPWEYEDKSLCTLCNVCHHQFHNSNNVPVYTNERQLLDFAVLCTRCDGSGYIPKYYYYKNGVCFSCAGEGVTWKDG